jgi:hypothetical protein
VSLRCRQEVCIRSDAKRLFERLRCTVAEVGRTVADAEQ